VQLKASKTILCFTTASYTDISNATEVNITNTRLQGLCTAYALDPMVGLKMVTQKYISKNNSPDWQNMHKPAAQPVLAGTAALVTFGYDPNGNNTEGYAMAIGANCQNLSGTEFAQTKIIAKNNDNLGGPNSFPISDSPTKSRIGATYIGNGNGTDDGWIATMTVTSDGTKATITKDFDLSIVTNEERSRAECRPTANADVITCCFAEGNSQPPNRGVRCAGVNVATTTPANQRILWKKYVAERNGNIYYSTPSLVNMPNPDGTASDRMMLSYVRIDTTNRQGRTKGKTDQFTVPLEVSATGFTMLEEPKTALLGIGDGAHPGLCSAVYGKEKRPVAFGFHPTITDGGIASMTIIGTDAAGKLAPIKPVTLGVSLAGGWISQYFGQNPNTPQGRNYAPECVTVDNPGYGVQGGFEPLVEKFAMFPVVGSKKRPDGKVQDKLALDIALFPSVVHDATDPINPIDPTNPTDPTDPGPTNGNGLGGCSTNGNGGSLMLALGLGLAFVVRRRR
jgi:MYXO-CTERM domain-containing protein